MTSPFKTPRRHRCETCEGLFDCYQSQCRHNLAPVVQCPQCKDKPVDVGKKNRVGPGYGLHHFNQGFGRAFVPRSRG